MEEKNIEKKPEEHSSEENANKEKSNKKIITILILVIALLLIGGGVGGFLMLADDDMEDEDEMDVVITDDVDDKEVPQVAVDVDDEASISESESLGNVISSVSEAISVNYFQTDSWIDYMDTTEIGPDFKISLPTDWQLQSGSSSVLVNSTNDEKVGEIIGFVKLADSQSCFDAEDEIDYENYHGGKPTIFGIYDLTASSYSGKIRVGQYGLDSPTPETRIISDYCVSDGNWALVYNLWNEQYPINNQNVHDAILNSIELIN